MIDDNAVLDQFIMERDHATDPAEINRLTEIINKLEIDLLTDEAHNLITNLTLCWDDRDLRDRWYDQLRRTAAQIKALGGSL